MRVQSLGQEDSLEKEMTPHPSILALKIPWAEQPGRLQSLGLQRVRHRCVTEHKHTSKYMYIQCINARGSLFPWEIFYSLYCTE